MIEKPMLSAFDASALPTRRSVRTPNVSAGQKLSTRIATPLPSGGVVLSQSTLTTAGRSLGEIPAAGVRQ